MMVTETKKDWLDRIRDIFDNKIPFNQVLGLQLYSLDMDPPKIRFDMHDALIGNYIRGSLHGGVISAVIDVTGGLAAFMGHGQKILTEAPDLLAAVMASAISSGLPGQIQETLNTWQRGASGDYFLDTLHPELNKKIAFMVELG